jgi:hypothetical protein
MEQYEDYYLDEDFNVESSGEFLDSLDGDELEFLYSSSGLKVCPNCGEFVSHLYDGICHLCSKSDYHREIRGNNSGDNINRDIDFIKSFNDR